MLSVPSRSHALGRTRFAFVCAFQSHGGRSDRPERGAHSRGGDSGQSSRTFPRPVIGAETSAPLTYSTSGSTELGPSSQGGVWRCIRTSRPTWTRRFGRSARCSASRKFRRRTRSASGKHCSLRDVPFPPPHCAPRPYVRAMLRLRSHSARVGKEGAVWRAY